MPQSIETSAGHRARINMRGAVGVAIPCLVILIAIDAFGYLPPQFSNGLWWEVPALVACASLMRKTF